MSGSLRDRVLAEVARRGRVDNPHELQRAVDSDSHSIVHTLYSLQKAGLVSFRLRKSPPAWRGKSTASGVSNRIPTDVQATKAGVRRARGI